ncbi:hypothetical protein MASR1M60_21820 [Rhodocyclaceae bacterium]
MTATTLTPANFLANAAIAHAKSGSSANTGNAASATGAAAAQGAGSPANAADPTAASPAASFGALFQQLMNKTLPPGTDLSLLDGTNDLAEKVGAGETAEELDALLPFLEAMGLAQSLTPEAAPVTPAVTSMPAITAGEDAVDTGNAPLAGMTDDTATSLVPAKDAQDMGMLGEGSDESASGGEFAAKLTAAADSNKQNSQAGGISNVAQHGVTTQVMTTTGPSHASTTTTMTISQPVGEAGWGQEVGQRIVWMANRSEGKAELVLTPPQMGRVEVSLTVSGDQASASFASANPVVREALESALPRLREALAEAGIQLGQAQVGAENAHHSAQQEKNPDKFGSHHETSVEKSSIMTSSNHDSAPSALKVGRGLVDVFA